jgi:hypothetical protein
VGQYIRDETEDARADEYLAHVVLDPIESFPPPYVTLKDTQYLQLFKTEHDGVAMESGYDDLFKRIADIIEWRRTKELGSFYDAHAWAAIRLLDRGPQEEPLRPHVVQEPAAGLYFVFGPQIEVPEQLYDRFCYFTMPANGEHKEDRPWIEIITNYVSGTLPLKPWQKPPVIHWPQVTVGAGAQSSYEKAVARIANQLYLAVPRIKINTDQSPLRRVLESIKYSGDQIGISYFAYSFISAERWADERETICALIERLGTELAEASVDNFRFLVVIERGEPKRGFLRRFFGRIGQDKELGSKEGGPSPTDFDGRPIWYRLPDLTSVQKIDFDDWAAILSTAWGVEVERARQSLVESFTDNFTSFAQASEVLVKFVLPRLWSLALPNLRKRGLDAISAPKVAA